jgi:hypothetical protein
VAIDDVAEKFRNCGKVVTLRHLSADCAALVSFFLFPYGQLD